MRLELLSMDNPTLFITALGFRLYFQLYEWEKHNEWILCVPLTGGGPDLRYATFAGNAQTRGDLDPLSGRLI